MTLQLKRLGSNYYAVDYEGEVTENDWEELDGFLYYFDNQGRMLRNCKYKIDGEYYLFDTDGTVYQGNSYTEFFDFHSNTYAVRTDGTVVAGKCAYVDGEKYYFDRYGVVQKEPDYKKSVKSSITSTRMEKWFEIVPLKFLGKNIRATLMEY